MWRIPSNGNSQIKSLAISDDANVIVTGNNDGSICVYDKTGNSHGCYPLEIDRNEYDLKPPVDISPNGNTIVAGNSVGTVFVFSKNSSEWNFNTNEPQRINAFEESKRPVTGVSVCSDYIFALSDQGIVQPISRTDNLLNTLVYSNGRGQAISATENCRSDGTGIVAVAHGQLATINKIMQSIPLLDKEPPTKVKIVSAKDGNDKDIELGSSTTSGVIKFAFTSEDNVGIKNYECNLDFKPSYSKCDEKYSVDKGIHVLQVLAIDTSGNTSVEPTSFFWQVQEYESGILGMRWGEFLIVVFTVPISVGTGMLVLDIYKKKKTLTKKKS